ncbi:cytochrome c oxidase assembly protein [Sphingoaurantiacus capsulatus]|uniref:Cytochrome c oxidase assembly protein n=1 Tax=Sphingoaurantiacus capsulatus TaxID=1771310 RepID=A0ABV7X7K1_9SPHN
MATGTTWMPYCGAAPGPAEMLSRWNFDPLLLAALAVSVLAWRWRFGLSKPAIAGFALMALLFVSPFCALSSALFASRVVHHLLLTVAVAPLLAVALPRSASHLALWTAGHALIFWAWHAPALYGWALSNDSGYWLMQLTILGSAVGFWRAALAAPAPVGAAALFATMVQMGLLGALLTFVPRPLYDAHLLGPLLWGLTPLEDQQAAGLIMWVVGGAAYLIAALTLAGRWLGDDRRAAV